MTELDELLLSLLLDVDSDPFPTIDPTEAQPT